MTPDMGRLCKAAENVELEGYAYLSGEDAGKVVRAVLMELREVSDKGRTAMEAALSRPRQHVGHRGSDEARSAYIALDAYVDHVLDTGARRDKALSELAKIDRDLL